jgi:hypothetical protein
MRWRVALLLLVFAVVPHGEAANTHQPPNTAIEQNFWWGDAVSPYVVSGCLPAVPASSLTLGAFACEAYVRGASGELLYVTQAAAPVTLANTAGSHWVAVCRDTASAVPGWTRQAGTHYLHQQSATKPEDAPGCQVIAHATVQGSIVSQVSDARRPRSYAREKVFDVSDPLYGATGDNVTNDRAAIQAAIAAAASWNKTILFPQGTYFVGAGLLPGTRIFDLSPYGDGLRLKTRGSVILRTDGSSPIAINYFFYLYNNNDFHAEPFEFHDNRPDSYVEWGAVGFFLDNGPTRVNWGNVQIDKVTCKFMFGCVWLTALSAYPDVSEQYKIRGVTLPHIFCYSVRDCFHTQNEGDDIVIGNIYAKYAVRTFYIYGSRGMDVQLIYSDDPIPSTGDVYIARQVGGMWTTGITIHNYKVRNATQSRSATNQPFVAIDHIDLLGGEIAGISITMDIEGPVNPWLPVKLRNYTMSGGSETTAPSANIVRDVRLKGTCSPGAVPVEVVATYQARRQMQFVTGQHFLPAFSLLSAFQLTQSSRAQTDAVWGAATTAPELGNGTLVYDIDVSSGMAALTMTLTAGSSTTFGTGVWSFSNFVAAGQPIVARTMTIGPVLMFDSGVTFRVGICRIAAGSSMVYCYVDSGGAGVGSTVPFTWSSGDYLSFTLLVPLSG